MADSYQCSAESAKGTVSTSDAIPTVPAFGSLCLHHLTGESNPSHGVRPLVEDWCYRPPAICRGCIPDGNNHACQSYIGIRVHGYTVVDDGMR